MSIGTSEEIHEIRLKRGRPIGSKDVTPRKRRTRMSIGTPNEVHDKNKKIKNKNKKIKNSTANWLF